jgi:tight adherence protein B
MTLWSIFALVFVAAILVIQGSFWLATDLRGNQKAVTRRLARRNRSLARAETLNVLRDKQGASFLNSSAFGDYLAQTGLTLSWPTLGLCAAAVSTVIGAPLWWFKFNVLIWASASLVGGPALVSFYVMRARRQRIDRFGAQLPDALDIIVRGLRVGHPFTSAMQLVAREMLPPIGPELGVTMDEISFGQEVMTALSSLYSRVGQDDLLFLVIAVGVQIQTGGNLADVLERLAALMRERVNMRLKVRALSAEGRLSAWFLTAMPFVLFAVVSLISPNYFTELKDSPALVPALIYASVSIVGSNYAIYRMVNFKV